MLNLFSLIYTFFFPRWMKIQVCLHVHAHACVHACLPGLIRNACLASRSLEGCGRRRWPSGDTFFLPIYKMLGLPSHTDQLERNDARHCEKHESGKKHPRQAALSASSLEAIRFGVFQDSKARAIRREVILICLVTGSAQTRLHNPTTSAPH